MSIQIQIFHTIVLETCQMKTSCIYHGSLGHKQVLHDQLYISDAIKTQTTGRESDSKKQIIVPYSFFFSLFVLSLDIVPLLVMVPTANCIGREANLTLDKQSTHNKFRLKILHTTNACMYDDDCMCSLTIGCMFSAFLFSFHW